MMTSENIKGKIITFEGPDGSFKETNSIALQEYIRDNLNGKCIRIAYPEYKSDSSYFVRQFLDKQYGELNTLNPYTISQFYALDRYDDKRLVNRLLKEGYTIIFDRYVGSNILFQSSAFDTEEEKDKYIDWICDLEYNINGLAKDDIVLFMYIPQTEFAENIKNRRNKEGIKNDIFETNEERQLKITNNYAYVCKKQGWNVVKCYECDYETFDNPSTIIYDKETIFNNILDILNKHFE